jgi:hypothetical protein
VSLSLGVIGTGPRVGKSGKCRGDFAVNGRAHLSGGPAKKGKPKGAERRGKFVGDALAEGSRCSVCVCVCVCVCVWSGVRRGWERRKFRGTVISSA